MSAELQLQAGRVCPGSRPRKVTAPTHLCLECDLGGLEGVVRREVDAAEQARERSTLEATI